MAQNEMAQNEWPELAKGLPEGLECGLRNFWYPILQSEDVSSNGPVAIKSLGLELVVWRDGQDRAHVFLDRCPHRYVKLSVGRVMEGDLQCVYHGLRFGAGGRCTLIPWEAEDCKLLDEISAVAYPTEELGGYVWAYIGDVEKFPPPPFEESVPEELFDDRRFVHFRLPTEVWNANWLLVVDGGDAYHAVTLHVGSQQHAAVLDYLDPQVSAQFASTSAPQESVALEDRRVKIVESDGHGLRGLSVDKHGRNLDHGHRLEKVDGERFNLPSLVTNPIRPVTGTAPYVSRFFQVPIDDKQTRLFRYAAWRVESDDEREHLKQHFVNVVRVRQLKTSAEDQMIAEANAALVECRENEFLLSPDRDVVRVRRKLAETFLAQCEGKRTPDREITPSRESMRFPI